MKYSDYNIVSLDFIQAPDVLTHFETKIYTKSEFEAILIRLKKSNILSANIKLVNGSFVYRAGIISEYTDDGYPIYSATVKKVTVALKVVEIIGERYQFQFDAV